jgi:hypothetical protein
MVFVVLVVTPLMMHQLKRIIYLINNPGFPGYYLTLDKIIFYFATEVLGFLPLETNTRNSSVRNRKISYGIYNTDDRKLLPTGIKISLQHLDIT